jgi:phosphoribosylaminoimidazole (AIR) synthetase
MGIGMVAIVDPQGLPEISRRLAGAGQRALPIGLVREGDRGVVYDLGLTEPEAEPEGAPG